jgi:hypothetical protein
VPENSSNKWTPEEDARLKSLVEANTSIHLIAAKLKRSVVNVKGPREHTGHVDKTSTGRAEGDGETMIVRRRSFPFRRQFHIRTRT